MGLRTPGHIQTLPLDLQELPFENKGAFRGEQHVVDHKHCFGICCSPEQGSGHKTRVACNLRLLCMAVRTCIETENMVIS